MLRTARLTCERFTMDHVQQLATMDRDADVQVWLFGKTYTPEETRARAERRVAYWNEHGAGDYIVHTADDGELIGFAGFFPSPRPNAIAIGYALFPRFWGHGYGTELADVLTRTALGFDCAEIVATVLATNAASRHVLEKTGFAALEPGPEDDPGTLVYRYVGRS
ncbi:MAG TPA: GNAT family N-acetyltransferase [Candidatus Elarobacter sp.]